MVKNLATKLLVTQLGLVGLALVAPVKKLDTTGTYLGPTSSYINKDKADGLFVEKPEARFAVKTGAYLTDEKTFPASSAQLAKFDLGKNYNISQRASILFNYSTRYSASN